jgi:hypothetical protein
MNKSLFSYWSWFFVGSGAKPGYRRLVNRWLLLHLAVGVLLAYVVKVNLVTAANSVLLPLVGILVGLSFAWAGNAQALMQSQEIDRLTEYHAGGFREYVFVFQTTILAILVTLVLWALAGLQVFDLFWPTAERHYVYFSIKVVLFSFSSLTLRECWHVVLGAQWMLLAQREIRKKKREKR